MSEELAKSTDIERLEERIDSLRLIVIVLAILVSLLYIILAFQLTLFLPYFVIIGIAILCLFLLANSCTKGNGPPVET